jgi:S1-C subfamily serine protease
MLGQNGFMGIGIMKRFTVVFDYGQEAFYLKPGRSYREPFEWNMAGLLVWVNRDGFLQVKDIVEASPGWDKGIRPGDIITAIDGRDVSEMSNAQMFDAFARDGAEVALSIRRDGDRKTVSLRLRRLI